jgi:hypothetical protein
MIQPENFDIINQSRQYLEQQRDLFSDTLYLKDRDVLNPKQDEKSYNTLDGFYKTIKDCKNVHWLKQGRILCLVRGIQMQN